MFGYTPERERYYSCEARRLRPLYQVGYFECGLLAMDPQSQAFTPYSNNDPWSLQTDVVRIQQVQTEHSERIARLERRQDDDARMKSVWGNSSPFPSVLSGTPQQGEHRL